MIAIVALTKGGIKKAYEIQNKLEADLYLKPFDGSFKEVVKKVFEQYDVVLFIMATGIVVRSIAPYLDHKSKDPAILVMDEQAQHVISLLSGHLGGANLWAKKIATITGATPVITTASDVNGILSVDMFALKHGLKILNYDDIKDVTSVLVDGGQVYLKADKLYDEKNYLSHDENTQAVLEITNRQVESVTSKPYAKLVQQNLILSIGCRKNISFEALKVFVQSSLRECGYLIEAVQLVTSAWVKAEEVCLVKLAEMLHVPFSTCDQLAIKTVEDRFQGSEFVYKTLGVKNVSESCGYIQSNHGKQLIDVIKHDGMTLSLWEMKG